MLMQIIQNAVLDEERALYAVRDTLVRDCRFDGPADGESAFKECRDVAVENSYFNLRYPFWHDSGLSIDNCELTDKCRAAIWYTDHAHITNSRLHGIKAVRECGDVKIVDSDIISPEFGWNTHDLKLERVNVTSEYFLLNASDISLRDVELNGKYSFQYVRHGELDHCVLNTKDAFWHSSHMTVRDSVVNGEYLGWYSDHLTLINCTISGTQPLCYCRDLKLINCRMEGADFAFERSYVNASLNAPVISIKNPYGGRITVPSVGEIIRDDGQAVGEVIVG
jgi:hypothetical protein